MGKVWVLDTGTKGTGAEMRPLEKVLRKPGPGVEPAVARPRPRPAEEPEPWQPPKFKVVDVMTHRVLAEDVGARAAVDLLEGIRSIFDVRIYVLDTRTGEWRMLNHRDQKVLWGFRGRPQKKDELR
jgi:hypothetical protein